MYLCYKFTNASGHFCDVAIHTCGLGLLHVHTGMCVCVCVCHIPLLCNGGDPSCFVSVSDCAVAGRDGLGGGGFLWGLTGGSFLGAGGLASSGGEEFSDFFSVGGENCIKLSSF